MIRYPITPVRLAANVDTASSNWRNDAQTRTALHIAAGNYTADDPHWSAIKSAFMKLQHFKCAYCERRLESQEIGRIEHDLEHFRPKKRVVNWPPKNLKSKFPFATGGSMNGGYYWLGHDFHNYAVSCKVCNTVLKKQYFPTAGTRGAAGDSVNQLQAEEPFLCFPIGNVDDDPRSLLKFDGIISIPASTVPMKIRRAEVIIEIFRLNDRDELLFGRSKLITLIGPYLRKESDGSASSLDRKVIKYCTSDKVEHASCLTDFASTWRADVARGERILQHCQRVFAR